MLIHSIVTGGQALFDCLNRINDLCSNINQDKKIVILMNKYFGDVVYEGKSFKDFKVYERNIDKIISTVAVPNRNKQLYGIDLAELFARHQTFAEAANDDSLPRMVRHRLEIWWSALCFELEANLPLST